MAKKKTKEGMSAGEKMQTEVYYITHYKEELEKATTDKERERINAEAIDKFLALKTPGALISATEFGYSPYDYLRGKISAPADRESGEDRFANPTTLVGLVHSGIREIVRRYGKRQ
jgi:hypothetical protein